MKWLFLFLPLFLVAQQIQTKAYVLNRTGQSISVIDFSTQEVIGTISMPATGGGVQLCSSLDQTAVYAPDNGAHLVLVIDTASDTITNTIAVSGDPASVAFSPNGTVSPRGFVVYSVNLNAHNVSIIDVTSKSQVSTISLPSSFDPWDLAFTPDGTEVYVGNFNIFGGADSSQVIVIDVETEMVTQTIPIGDDSGVAFVAISPDGTVAYATTGQSGVPLVSIIDTSTYTVENTITMPAKSSSVAFSPDGTLAYVSTVNSDVQVIDTASQMIIGNIPVGNTPEGITFFDNSTAYVANSASNNVSVLDVASQTEENTIAVGNTPYSIAFATVFPSLSIQGVCKEDVFFTQKELYNEISWAGVESASSYVVYRDASLSTVAGRGSSAQFFDHSRRPHQTYSYFITAISALTGEEKLIGSVSVTCP